MKFNIFVVQKNVDLLTEKSFWSFKIIRKNSNSLGTQKLPIIV